MSLGNCQLSNCNACNTKKIVFGNCYLLSVICNAKNSFMETVNCQTVTLGDGVIDLSCDIIKIKLKKFGTYRFYSYICNVNNCNYC